MPRTPRLRLALALAAAPLFGCTSCETTGLFEGDPNAQLPKSDEWQETEPLKAASFDLLWERAKAVFEGDDWPVDQDLTRYEKRELVSKWRTTLAPTRFEGQRRRAHVVFVPAGDCWIVRAAVLRQRNADIDDPTNPAQAQWERATPSVDVTKTAVLVWKIRAGFVEESEK